MSTTPLSSTPLLEAYKAYVPQQELDRLTQAALKLRGKLIRHINSTAYGGGVAEILNRMLPLMRAMGLDAHWDIFKGEPAFYGVTKRMHNALHGVAETFSEADWKLYWEIQEKNLIQLGLTADFLLIHDPQPAGLVRWRDKIGGRWAWRCHVDVSSPAPEVWTFLTPLIQKYDASIFSAPSFARDFGNRVAIIAPSIDPLSDKNRDIEAPQIEAILSHLKIPTDKPLVTQVSRFDRLKDPVGVIEAYQQAKKEVDCRLLLVGGSADDDPEGAAVLAEVRERAGHDPDILILELSPTSHIEVNAIQRASTVIMQKSLKEGFGLTVAEAMWKSKPVIAGAVGGIPLQIRHEQNGVLVHSVDEAARWIVTLLRAPELARRLGENAREQVRERFLITRHLRDYLELFSQMT